jgi:hypothetical protein
MAVTESDLEVCYRLSKSAYGGEMKVSEAINAISSNFDIPVSSATTIVRNLSHLLKGEKYTRRLSSQQTQFFLQSILQDYGDSGLRNALAAFWAHIEYYEAQSGTNSVTDRRIHEEYSDYFRSKAFFQRHPVDTLNLVSPEHIWNAVQMLLYDNVKHGFGPSTGYDMIVDDGYRLAPQAVFGIALSLALNGAEIGPRNFSGGESSACFRILREAGYQIVPKGEEPPSPEDELDPDQEWYEGKRKLRTHFIRERAPGLARAKKAQYRKENNGKLTCQRCGLDPVAYYDGIDQAEACIEVHHANVAVSKMGERHRTKLNDLQCLCASCHRIAHRILAKQ